MLKILLPHHLPTQNKEALPPILPPSLALYEMLYRLPSLIFHLLTFHTETETLFVVLEGNYFYPAEDWITEEPNNQCSDSSKGSVGPAFPSQFQFSPQMNVDGLLESTASPWAGNPPDAISGVNALHSSRETSSQGRTPQALPQSCKWLRSENNWFKQTDQLNTSCLPTEQLNLGGGNSWTWRSQTAVSLGKREIMYFSFAVLLPTSHT